jgi:hypothetical protein
VFDLESTRFKPGRTDSSNQSQTGFYGLGFDWTVPIAFKGTGLFIGAEGTYGILQSTNASNVMSSVNTDGVLQLMPHAGVGLAFRGVGLFADAGWRFQLFENSSSGKAGVDGLVLQGGVRVDMKEGRDRDDAWNIGYTARAFTPNGSNLYSQYGGLPGMSGAGPMLGHQVTITGNGDGRRWDQGLAFIYMGADSATGLQSLRVMDLGYIVTWHAFETHQAFNPYLGVRAGIGNVTGAPSVVSEAYYLSLSAHAGLDLSLGRSFVLRTGFAYDGTTYSNTVSNGSLDGYALEAGLIVRL